MKLSCTDVLEMTGQSLDTCSVMTLVTLQIEEILNNLAPSGALELI